MDSVSSTHIQLFGGEQYLAVATCHRPEKHLSLTHRLEADLPVHSCVLGHRKVESLTLSGNTEPC